MKHKLFICVKKQASFFSQIWVSVLVLSREKWIKKVICTIYTYSYNPCLSLTVLSYVNPSYLDLSLTPCFITLLPTFEDM